MAENTVPYTVRQGEFKLADLNYSNTYTVRFTNGVLNASIPGTESQLLLDRNQITSPPRFTKGADRPCSFDFEVELIDVLNSGSNTIYDIIHKIGLGANWVSSLGAGANVPYHLYFQLKIDQSLEGGNTKYLLWPHCKLEATITLDTPGKIKISGVAGALQPTHSTTANF